jgi:hypothetical protein
LTCRTANRKKVSFRWAGIHCRSGPPNTHSRSCQGASVVLLRSLEIRRAEPPIHAPAPIADAVLAEEVFQSGPQIRREWADGELHADLVSAPHNARVERRPTCEARRELQASEARLRQSARTRGWASSFPNRDSWPRHARAFSTSAAICTNSTLGRTP